MARPKQPPPNNKRCTAKTSKGPRCENPRVPGDDKCFAHSPKKAKERKAAQKKGGKNAHKPLRVVDPGAARLAFKKSMDVIGALEDVFDEVRKGKLDHRIGQTLGMLGSTMLKGLQYKESDDQDQRIASLEKLLEQMKRVQGHAGNANGQAAKVGQDRAVASEDGEREDSLEDPQRWLASDESDGEEPGPVAGLDSAQPLW